MNLPLGAGCAYVIFSVNRFQVPRTRGYIPPCLEDSKKKNILDVQLCGDIFYQILVLYSSTLSTLVPNTIHTPYFAFSKCNCQQNDVIRFFSILG
jgi:hypothetical protein